MSHPHPIPRYVAYFRVSTARQGKSGLGIEAQQEAVRQFLNGQTPLAEFVEVESGRRTDRPQLEQALAACRVHRATLVIAKLDRLARNVAFVSNLMEADVEFLAVDFPQANRLTIHILAAVAEHEARVTSERTRSALAAAKARGTVLGGFRGRSGTREDCARATRSRIAAANQRATDLGPLIESIKAAGKRSLREIAAELNAHNVRTALGRSWTASQVRRVTARLNTIGLTTPKTPAVLCAVTRARA